MNNKLTLALFSLILLISGVSCQLSDNQGEKEQKPDNTLTHFPVEDDSRLLSGSDAAKFKVILEKTDHSFIGMETTRISDTEYQEIKAFTDELVRTSGQGNVYLTVFDWIRKNIKYDYSDNDPYPVFKNRKGVCQGYANLLKVMLLSQGIPSLVVLGDLGEVGAHAWNYSYAYGKWTVGDPTNGGNFGMDDLASYENWLVPHVTDITVYEDDNFTYGYSYGINVKAVKINPEKLTIPFGVLGYQIGMLNPQVILPQGIKDIYIGSNIRNFGLFGGGMLDRNAPLLQNVFVAENNPELEDYEGIVYRKQEEFPCLIPAGREVIKFKAVRVIPKNALYGHQTVKEIWFGAGTEKIENSAIEACPELEKIYVPNSVTQIAENAFYNVNNAQVIRY